MPKSVWGTRGRRFKSSHSDHFLQRSSELSSCGQPPGSPVRLAPISHSYSIFGCLPVALHKPLILLQPS
jgi:hypothetical protein